nr:MAG TPA: hypothetical protein [Caudoviricetes sp.]
MHCSSSQRSLKSPSKCDQEKWNMLRILNSKR